ncbi:MAG: STAS domain-containing protein [Sporomusaceae bacterium]|nr:STAS domain-containing protein [Sporomusaceae bacterium]
MEIEVNTLGATKIVIIPAKVDGVAVAAVETTLRGLIGEGNRNILCNFSRTAALPPAGLAMFIAVLKDLHRLQGQMAFCLMRPEVRETFDAAGLTSLYRYYDHDEALRVEILRELSAHFDEYADLHAIRLRQGKDRLSVELFLEFDGDRKMSQVQQSIDKIKLDLEAKIKDGEILIIPATSAPSAAQGGKTATCK